MRNVVSAGVHFMQTERRFHELHSQAGRWTEKVSGVTATRISDWCLEPQEEIRDTRENQEHREEMYRF